MSVGVSAPRRAPSLGWDAPAHALMLAVMAATMLPAPALPPLAGVALLVPVSLALAPLMRRRSRLRSVQLDLWAMIALLTLAALGGAAASGHHGIAVGGWPAAAAVVVAWALTRAGMLRSAPTPAALASAALTALGLVAMLATCV